MKKYSAVSIILAAVLLASCSSAKSVETTTSEETAAAQAEETTEETTELGDPYDYTMEEPVITDISDTKKEIIFHRDDHDIKGEMIIPEGEGPFPVIIMSCGLYTPASYYEDRVEAFAENGYAAIIFDCPSNPPIIPNPDRLPDNAGELIFEQVLDLCCVMDSIQYIDEANADESYLWGHSLGGLVTVIAGLEKQDMIKGMLFVEPSFDSGEFLVLSPEHKLNFQIYRSLADCKVDTVIFEGTHNGFGDEPWAFDRAIGMMPSSELIIIDGADHMMEGEYAQEMVDKSCKMIAKWNR